MIRVLLADDQALVRRGVRALLDSSPDIRVVVEVADGDEALAALRTHEVDVLVLDVRMPRLGGVGVLEALRGTSPAPPALLLTTFDDSEALIAGLRAGAKGFMLKSAEPAELFAAIETIASGGSCFVALGGDRLIRALTEAHAHETPVADAITARERDVLRLMTQGLSNRQIARALRLSEGTVKNHVSVVMAKLQVTSRTKAALVALSQGLID
jgi:DNA-binding NarL/FixJ family response regulator